MSKRKERIKDILRNSDKPMGVEPIRVKAEIGVWASALAHCLELVLLGEIKGFDTGSGWVFWIDGGGV